MHRAASSLQAEPRISSAAGVEITGEGVPLGFIQHASLRMREATDHLKDAQRPQCDPLTLPPLRGPAP